MKRVSDVHPEVRFRILKIICLIVKKALFYQRFFSSC